MKKRQSCQLIYRDDTNKNTMNNTKNTIKTRLYIGAAILACITVTIATTTSIFATSDTTRPYLTAATYVTNDDNTETITVTFNEPVWFDAAETDNNLISEEFTCTEGGRSEETGGFELRVRGRRLAINSVSLPTTEEGASVTVTITAASFGTSSPRLEYYPFTNQVAYCSSGDFNLLEEADFQIRDVAENMARGKVVSTRRAAEVTTTDATVPTIITQDITSSNANSAYAKAGDTLTLTFMTSETLSQTPTVQIAGNSTEVTPNGNTYTATYMVTTDTPDGAVTYNIGILTDMADNTADPFEETDNSIMIDTTAPVITLTGDNPLLLTVGDTYTDPGATATEGVEVTPTGTVDTDTAGDYTITYTATDAAGNIDTTTRTVRVQVLLVDDTLPPRITSAKYVINDDTATITITFDEPVWFDAAGTENTPISEIATCPAGNTYETGGFIMKKGRNRLTINSASFSTTKEEASVTATITSTDFRGVGPYLRYYQFIDHEAYCSRASISAVRADFQIRDVAGNMVGNEGNRVAVLRNVYAKPLSLSLEVLTTGNPSPVFAKERDVLALTFVPSAELVTAPTVTIAGKKIVSSRNSGAHAEHAAYTEIEDASDNGVYTVVYTVASDTPEGPVIYDIGEFTDIIGRTTNPSPVTSSIVVDTTAPVITLKGSKILFLDVGDTYTDPGATADTGETVTPTGTVDTDTAGKYTISYVADDEAGNQVREKRTVTVIEFFTDIEFTSNNLVSHQAKEGDTLTLTFTVFWADPNRIPTVQIAGNDAAVEVGEVTESGRTIYTATYMVTENTPNGEVTYDIGEISYFGNVINPSANTNTNIFVDTTPPVITLTGNNPLLLTVGDTYTDPGAASEPGVTVTASPETIDTDTAGQYTITYTATDAAGNRATKERTVTVIPVADTIAPTVSAPSFTSVLTDGYLNTEETKTSVDLIIEPVATDDGGSVTLTYALIADTAVCNDTTTGFNTDIPQTVDVPVADAAYKVCVRATDQANNNTHVTSDSFISDMVAPYLTETPTLATSNTDNAYAKEGDRLTLTFTVSETLSQAPTVQIAGNDAEVGANGNTYTATYTVTTDTPDGAVTYDIGVFTDMAENTFDPSEETDSSITIDTTAPVITLTGNNPLLLTVGDTYTDPGAASEPGVTVTASPETIDTDTAGQYTITYTATDAAGNRATKERTVTVIPVADTIAPTVSAPSFTSVLTDGYLNTEETKTSVDLIIEPVATDDGGSVTLTYALIADTAVCNDTTTGFNTDIPQTVDVPVADAAYKVCVRATDQANNNTHVTSDSFTRDTVAPLVTLNGDAVIEVEEGSSITDIDLTATANGGETVIVAGTADTSIPGTYIITYTATDAAGNTGTAEQTVEVAASPQPEQSAQPPSTPLNNQRENDGQNGENDDHTVTDDTGTDNGGSDDTADDTSNDGTGNKKKKTRGRSGGGGWSGVLATEAPSLLPEQQKDPVSFTEAPSLLPEQQKNPVSFNDITLPSIIDDVHGNIVQTYRLGDSSDEIRSAQKLLNQTVCPVATDGAGSDGEEVDRFGALTHRAIMCYEESKGLPITGVLTPELYSSLYNDYIALLKQVIFALIEIINQIIADRQTV